MDHDERRPTFDAEERVLRVRSLLPMLLPAIGCVGYAPPAQHLASAMASVHFAEDLGATALPTANHHVKLAQEQIARAKVLMQEGSNEKADYMTMRAYNDAELAIALTREASARARAEQAAEALRTVARPSP